MPDTPRILIAMGTRPEIIKMAPLCFALRDHPQVDPVVLHTGQHDDLAWPLYKFFGIAPDMEIEIDRESEAMRVPGSQSPLLDLPLLAAELTRKTAPIMHKVAPSLVLVHGDTISALMAALTAYFMKIPVAHIEAGLRSHDKYQPFPEEMNRILISRIADIHFAPTSMAKDNLLHEGVLDSDIHVVGNTVVDAMKYATHNLDATLADIPALKKALKQVKNPKLVLVTAHRRENVEGNIAEIFRMVAEILAEYDDIIALWPVHPNPRITKIVNKESSKLPPKIAARFCATKPLDYPSLLTCIRHAWLVLTDSGGIVEESAALSRPVLILRNTTERPEVLKAGIAKLVGVDRARVLELVREFHEEPKRYAAMTKAKNPFGDGTSAAQIIAHLERRYFSGISKLTSTGRGKRRV